MSYTIQNPIIPGYAPDPSIIRVDHDYYIATSTFHLNPAISIYHSTDLANWEMVDHGLKNHEVDLRGTNTPAGIWAPHLSYDVATKKFWLAYSHMLNMEGREFNADNYAISADSIHGPWSEPVFLGAIGFDPSLFHDEDGRHYMTILEWETRDGYQHPGHIVIQEMDLANNQFIGEAVRVTQGFTTRGCAEAPQIYKRDGYYYLVLAAGGTGYAHGVEMGRSKNIFGPYEANPTNEPIITSAPQHIYSLGDPDAGHFEAYNPHSIMQKSGHGSIVQTHTGEWYIAHLMSRPLPGTTLNPLGRETAIQKMTWNDAGWLQMADGSNLAKMTAPGMTGVEAGETAGHSFEDQFENETYNVRFTTPYREQNTKWVNTSENQGHLRIHGENSFFSRMNPAIMAVAASAFEFELETQLEFHPEHYSQSAGMNMYYDASNWLYARLYHSESLGGTTLGILQAKQGERIEFIHDKVFIPNGVVALKFVTTFGKTKIYYQIENQAWKQVGPEFNTAYLSDEGVGGSEGEIGGFTGLLCGIGAVDAYRHESYADFDFFKMTNK
ncbi:glycoside hydrolase family 43 protein [Periweissella cryptocerci]|uniref:Glycoside hydrolase family 43 protein n=1 Tax=Periweissella cryptocerci TaxID=2506420 RepID=A0A4P6YVS7_9LACO|nr:family 43 glycosylhydrolase [Periweissella cryptocerci]QBO36908.1 glycoside hydrolase family 43 protein [Periweissella cryptocerci]